MPLARKRNLLSVIGRVADRERVDGASAVDRDAAVFVAHDAAPQLGQYLGRDVFGADRIPSPEEVLDGDGHRGATFEKRSAFRAAAARRKSSAAGNSASVMFLMSRPREHPLRG